MSTTSTKPTTIREIGSYSIRPSADNSRFRLTIPKEAMRECNIDEGDRLAVQPTIDADGSVTLRYIPAEYAPDGQMTVAVNEHNSGVTRIPSATGQAFGFDDSNELNWSIIEEPLTHAAPEDIDGIDDEADDPRVPVLEGESNLVVDEVSPKSALPMSREPIERKVQKDVEHEGKSWSQEQFRYYLSPSEMETLDWESGTEVAVSIARREARPAIVFTPIEEADNTRLTKTVNSTGTNGDGLLYISRDIVRSFGLVGQPLMWVNDDGHLVATKTGRNR